MTWPQTQASQHKRLIQSWPSDSREERPTFPIEAAKHCVVLFVPGGIQFWDIPITISCCSKGCLFSWFTNTSSEPPMVFTPMGTWSGMAIRQDKHPPMRYELEVVNSITWTLAYMIHKSLYIKNHLKWWSVQFILVGWLQLNSNRS